MKALATVRPLDIKRDADVGTLRNSKQRGFCAQRLSAKTSMIYAGYYPGVL